MKVEGFLLIYFCLILDRICILYFVFLYVYYKNLFIFGGVIKIYFNVI